MLCHLMQNKLLSIDIELEEDQFKGLEMRELNHTKNLLDRSTDLLVMFLDFYNSKCKSLIQY